MLPKKCGKDKEIYVPQYLSNLAYNILFSIIIVLQPAIKKELTFCF